MRDVVEIRLPADGAYLSILRTATAGLAARLDFTLDEIEDLRIAVDEACAMLLPDAEPGSDLGCAFELSADAMTVTVTVATVNGRLPDRGRSPGPCCRRSPGPWTRVDDDSRVSITLHKRRPARRRERAARGRQPSRAGARRDPAANGPLAILGSGHRRGRVAANRTCAPDRGSARELFLALSVLPEDDPRRRAARDSLVQMHLPLVEHLARRFRNRGEPYDDLVQVATIGLIKSVDRFDLEARRGVLHLRHANHRRRDQAALPRQGLGRARAARLQELRLQLTSATGQLSQENGRAPTVAELAVEPGISEEEVLEGLESANAYSTLSLDAPEQSDDESPAVAETLGEEDEALEGVEYRESLKPLLEGAAAAGEEDPAAALLRQHDAVADRRRDRHLADARLPLARPDARSAPAEPARRRLSSGSAPERSPTRPNSAPARPAPLPLDELLHRSRTVR